MRREVIEPPIGVYWFVGCGDLVREIGRLIAPVMGPEVLCQIRPPAEFRAHPFIRSGPVVREERE